MITRKLLSTLQNILRMSTQSQLTQSYVWIDLELTGLEPEKDTILEIACIVTNPELKPVDNGLAFVIHQPEDVLNSMNSWSQEHHLKTGLTEASRNSKISITEAEKEMCDYVKRHAEGTRYIAGNSVYMDKLFLMKHMPNLDSLFHYRILDVSTVKLLCSLWYPEQFSQLPQKQLKHRAVDDINESIKELMYYQKAIFK